MAGLKQISINLQPQTCPFCRSGSATEQPFGLLENHKNQYGQWSLWACPFCGVQFWWPLVHPGQEFYENVAFYLDRDCFGLGVLNAQQRHFLRVLPKALQDRRDVKLLDIGCGSGEFLNFVRTHFGWDVWGIDMNRKVIETARRLYKLENLIAVPLERLGAISIPRFDVVTAFEVIEHLENPNSLIRAAHNVTSPGGMLVLSTPNRKRLVGRRALSDFPPVHLTRWDKTTLGLFVERRGFVAQRIDYAELNMREFISNLFSEGQALSWISPRVLKKPFLRILFGSRVFSGEVPPESISPRRVAVMRLVKALAYVEKFLLGAPMGLPLRAITGVYPCSRSYLVGIFRRT